MSGKRWRACRFSSNQASKIPFVVLPVKSFFVRAFFKNVLDCCQTLSYFQLRAPLLCKYTSSAPSPHRPHSCPYSKNSSQYSSFLFLLVWLVADLAGPQRPALWPLILSTLHGGFRVRPQSQWPLPAAPVLISTSCHTGSTHPPLTAP